MRTLRSRFLAVVVLGVILPVALVGIWLARDTRREGELLLRARLAESLDRMSRIIGENWVDQRSRILQVAEAGPTRQLLAATVRGTDVTWQPSLDGQTSAALSGALQLRDSSGAVRAAFAPPPTRAPALHSSSSVAFALPVFDPESNRSIGSLSARISIASLLGEDVWWPGVLGAVVVLYDSAGGAPLNPTPMPPALLAGHRFTWRSEDWIVEQLSFREPQLTVALAAPLGAFTEPFSRAAQRGTWALGGVLALALLVAAAMTRQIVEPVQKVASAAGAIAAGQLDQSVPERGPVEIRGLGKSFNAMAGSLRDMLRVRAQQESVAAVGQFATTLAHEVRNPLAALRFDLEHARERLDQPDRADALIARAVEGVERLDKVVRGSLSIARSGSLSLSQLDVRDTISAAVHDAAPTFEARQVGIELMLSESPTLANGNDAALQQLLLNVLLNAAEASSPGTVTRVTTRTQEATIEIRIQDEGAGIDAGILGRVAEPFFTTKERGTGLGLAVAQRIAAAHGGGLRIESRAGSGTTVIVSLPRQSEKEEA